MFQTSHAQSKYLHKLAKRFKSSQPIINCNVTTIVPKLLPSFFTKRNHLINQFKIFQKKIGVTKPREGKTMTRCLTFDILKSPHLTLAKF
jgi:hypothetical protein